LPRLGANRPGDLYREHRTLVWLSIVIFVNQLGFGAIIPVAPLFAQTFGVSQTAIGLTIAVYGLARFLVSMPTGQLSDRIGRRWTLVIGEVLTMVGNLLCGLAGSYEQFLLFRFVAGAGASMVVTSGQVILADISTPANRGRVMGIYQSMFLFGVGVGPLPGGIMAERLSLGAPFFAFAALGGLAAIVAFNRVPETRGIREKREALGQAQPFVAVPLIAQLRTIFSQVGFALVSLVSFVQFFSRTGGIFAVVPLLAVSKLGLGADQIGLGLTLVSLVNLGMVYLAGVLVDRYGRKPVIVPSTLLTGAAFAMLALAPSYGWFVASLAVWGVSAGISSPAPSAYAADLAPRGMNAIAMSSYRMLSEFGYVAGPMTMGWMADLWGGEASLLSTAALFAVAALAFGLFAPETGPKGRRR
jgi:MFS transporter, DHA1 family, multidrug resistance protein